MAHSIPVHGDSHKDNEGEFEFPPGPRYTLHITFRSGRHLPVGDLATRSSDPYIISTLRFPNSGVPKLHRRTSTIQTTLEPVWNEQWTVSNVPVTGVELKLKVMDEDTHNHDDKLGVARIYTGQLDRSEADLVYLEILKPSKGVWSGAKRAMASGCGPDSSNKAEVEFSIRVEQMDRPDESLQRAYTLAPNWYSRQFGSR